jgi:hypothetical protein
MRASATLSEIANMILGDGEVMFSSLASLTAAMMAAAMTIVETNLSSAPSGSRLRLRLRSEPEDPPPSTRYQNLEEALSTSGLLR